MSHRDLSTLLGCPAFVRRRPSSLGRRIVFLTTATRFREGNRVENGRHVGLLETLVHVETDAQTECAGRENAERRPNVPSECSRSDEDTRERDARSYDDFSHLVSCVHASSVVDGVTDEDTSFSRKKQPFQSYFGGGMKVKRILSANSEMSPTKMTPLAVS